MSISAAMIVRNEAHHLHDCIESLVGQVDEIILLDTGSTDGTTNLDWLERLTAPIILATFPWCDDFSAARNEAIGYCQGDWILIVDADDRLQGDVRKLTDEAPKDVMAFPVNTISTWPDGHATISDDHCRLWRRGLGIHYRRRVHELPYLPDGSDVPMQHQDQVTLRHVGYESSADGELGRKRERNSRLVMMGLEEEPRNPRYWFDAARVALGDGDVETALDRAAIAIQWWAMDGSQRREFVGPCLDLALKCATLTGRSEVGQVCWNEVPPEYRTDKSAHYFGKLLVG